MSRRHLIRRRLRTLGEISEILDSMRTLAVIEARRLTRAVDCQRDLVEALKRMAAELLRHFPWLQPDSAAVGEAYLILGSERGFCGDFNARLRWALEQRLKSGNRRAPPIIAVGTKVATELAALDAPIFCQLQGPLTAEESGELLPNLAASIQQLLASHGMPHLIVLHHADETGTITETPLTPPFRGLSQAQERGHPPLLYESPEVVFHRLTEHYLFAVLRWLLDRSLLAEHQFRIRHLDGATRRIGETVAALRTTGNRMRQEEITEELEVILLGAEAIDGI
ncbi:MAG TPA: FoF1 ATP synthase subunit gamma [Methylococcus sp.]|nr:FoF1 ATP synthase subunit gamma [Methylococcus sp.]